MLVNRDRAEAVMEAHGLDALVATTPENVHYLSDYGTQHSYNFAAYGISAAVLPRRNTAPPTLLVNEFEIPAVAESPSWMPELRAIQGIPFYVRDENDLGEADRNVQQLAAVATRNSHTNRQRALGKILAELGLARARLGFDDVRVMLELAEGELDEATSFDAINIFREVRAVKTEAELALLRKASRINQAALVYVAELAEEGVTCGELIRTFRALMNEQGGYGSHIVGGGHDRPWVSNWNTTYKLKHGDVLHIDPCGWYGHYWADQGRSLLLGEDRVGRFDSYYAALQAAHTAADPLLQAGNSTATVKDAARRAVGGVLPLPGFVPLIHAIGLEQYDHPQSLGEFLSEDFALLEGMVVNFETIYFELGWGSLQLEDTYLIGSSAPTRLGTLEQEPFRKA